MIGHKIKKSKNSKEYLRYYQCGNYRNKGSAVCNSNLIKADEVERFVFGRLEEITSKPTVLKSIVEKVKGKIGALKEPIKDRLNYILEQLNQAEKNINKYLLLIEKSPNLPESIVDRISDLDKEKKALLEQKEQLKYELNKPTIKEISLEQLQSVLSTFSKILPSVAPEKQKDFLHSIINKITVNEGDSPEQRSVKDIELYFDASKNNNYVLTYDTVHRTGL